MFECPVCQSARSECDHNRLYPILWGCGVGPGCTSQFAADHGWGRDSRLATSCAQVPSTHVAGTPSHSVSIEPIVGALAPVVDGQKDFLEPAPSSLSPKLSLQEVLTRLHADPSTAEFVRVSARLGRSLWPVQQSRSCDRGRPANQSDLVVCLQRGPGTVSACHWGTRNSRSRGIGEPHLRRDADR